jgi:hypothetical protein
MAIPELTRISLLARRRFLTLSGRGRIGFRSPLLSPHAARRGGGVQCQVFALFGGELRQGRGKAESGNASGLGERTLRLIGAGPRTPSLRRKRQPGIHCRRRLEARMHLPLDANKRCQRKKDKSTHATCVEQSCVLNSAKQPVKAAVQEAKAEPTYIITGPQRPCRMVANPPEKATLEKTRNTTAAWTSLVRR